MKHCSGYSNLNLIMIRTKHSTKKKTRELSPMTSLLSCCLLLHEQRRPIFPREWEISPSVRNSKRNDPLDISRTEWMKAQWTAHIPSAAAPVAACIGAFPFFFEREKINENVGHSSGNWTWMKILSSRNFLNEFSLHVYNRCLFMDCFPLVYFQISRQSIDACKDYFRDDLLKSDWALMVELKKTFQIL